MSQYPTQNVPMQTYQPPYSGSAPQDAQFAAHVKSKQRYDYVIVTPRVQDSEAEEEKSGCCCCGGDGDSKKDATGRAFVETNLKAAGLDISTVKSRDGDEFFIRIRASQERLEKHAEYIKLEVPTKVEGTESTSADATEEIYGECAPFISRETDPRRRDLFPPEFSSLIRQQLIRDIIESKAGEYPGRHVDYDIGAGIDMHKALNDGLIVNFLPLHEKSARRALISTWAKKWFNKQPLDQVRDYFGEKISMYFGFYGFYTTMLTIPAVLGIPTFALQFSDIGASSWVTPTFAIIIMLWTTLFLELWKRQQARFAYHWGTYDFEERERPRPQFRGELRYGFYGKGGWIALDDVMIPKGSGYVDRIAGRPIPENYYYSHNMRIGKYVLAYPLVLMFVVVVCIVALSILLMRAISIATPWFPIETGATMLNGIIMAVSIIVLNIVYQKIAVKLTDWENHRTQTEYEDALIVKTFLFQFINSYFTLFYIAFFKGRYSLCLFGSCQTDPCVDNNCFNELFQQLAIIFLVKQLFNNFMGIALPWITGKIKMKLEDRAVKKMIERGEAIPKKASTAEVESKKPKYESTFDDYNEMLVQFGFLTLFVPAFPLAPLAALLNNFIEIRTDALKLLTAYQRPDIGRAQDIGTWYNILETVSTISVVTNAFILAFTSNSFAEANGLMIVQRVWFAFILEHCVFLVKIVLAYVIPDVPGEIRKELSKRQWYRDAMFTNLEMSVEQKEHQFKREQEIKHMREQKPPKTSSSDLDVGLDEADEDSDDE